MGNGQHERPRTNEPSNTEKDPEAWKTGEEPMTGAQRSYLKTLADEAKEPFDESLSKAEASKRIDELRAGTARPRARAAWPDKEIGGQGGADELQARMADSLGRIADTLAMIAKRLDRPGGMQPRQGGRDPRGGYQPRGERDERPREFGYQGRRGASETGPRDRYRRPGRRWQR